ncbi:Uncharacterised protein [Mycobacteroides abscessus subsp. abscessus]|uniref:hypothetical protein n=1 Tax=Mycobacteroides abscessus TaxID=36809 RepID=UPI000929635B|nr:hypothetical protein [Mycobacteroides abscessus]SHT84073.1 Uncharacterised protein [Mycobacteroides abscessus subsp. abscessus]SKO51964.1 Uncharacterised protein [Mycobacteroides abscessus subsp. abscessus]
MSVTAPARKPATRAAKAATTPAPAKAVAPKAEPAPVVLSKKVTSATKFRVAVRYAAQANGWTFEQISTNVDQYTKGQTTVHVHHGASDLVTKAEKLEGTKPIEQIIPGSKLKVEKVHNWLAPKEQATEFLKVPADKVAEFESGKGLALIKVMDEPKPAK